MNETLDRLDEHLDVMPREISITRVINAPRELVFDAYTNREHIDQWWGPNGFRNETAEMDVRPGGVWRFVMHAPNGTDYGNRIVYREVVRPERLVFDHGADVDNDPNQFHVTVTFDAKEGKTKLTQRMLFKTAEQRAQAAGFGAIELGNQTLGKFETFVMKMVIQAANQQGD